MGLKVKAKLSVWEVKKNGKYTDIKATTRKQNKQTNGWETDFSGYIRLVGNANTKASDFPDGKFEKPLSIESGGFEVTQKYSKEHEKTFTNFIMFDFEMVGEATPAPVGDGFMNIPDSLVDELPFN